MPPAELAPTGTGRLAGAGVLGGDGGGGGCVAGDGGVIGRDGEVGIVKGAVGEAVAKGVEHRAGEVAVGAVDHGVVGEGGEIVNGFVKGDGEAAGGVVV